MLLEQELRIYVFEDYFKYVREVTCEHCIMSSENNVELQDVVVLVN